ncbi:hypothetical protein FACS1894190_17020 [Spirochaetia bacterium]|nr:hypothetical protein FACS1894190_17020 [Spirochaetia bacterium]
MAKELIEINGKYYFIDDRTGDLFEVILKDKTTDPAILKEALLQVIRLKDSQIKNGS